ncbi:hypothetical protein E2I00_007936, partial [Balaenoptera physalus]
SYRRRESKRKKSFLLCIGWLALTDLVGQLLTSPVVIVLYLSHQRWEQLDPPSHNWGNIFFASSFAFLGLSALAVTFACNLATIKALVSRCRAKATASQSSAQWGRITTETAIQLMGIMCVLSVCWSPLL